MATAAFLPAAGATTAPALTVKIYIVMTDSGVTISRVKAFRGWYAHFIVVNKGTKPHKFDIGGMTTPVLGPGKGHTIKAELAMRGTVTYQDDLNPKNKSSSGSFSVV